MSTNDLSRSATDHRKHYNSVRAQQGRVFVDDDHNENERLHIEHDRRSLVDIIGPAGTPDGGFLIANPRITGGFIDFDIDPGSFYLGGFRLELEADRKSTRLNSSHLGISYAVFCLNKKKNHRT